MASVYTNVNVFLSLYRDACTHKLIHESQIGFTKKARTSDHLFVLKCILDEYCSERNVDFQKAFDTFIHTGLKIKLLKLGVGSLFYQVIHNMYKTSRSCVHLQNGTTDFFSVHLGVKQGDNLTPNLFKIFINDLPSYLDKSLDPVYLNEKPIHYLMYADDIVLLSSTPQGLQTKLNSLDKYCDG